MASNGIKDRVAIVGMGCTQVRRALGQGRRGPARRRRLRGLRSRPASIPTTSTPTGSARMGSGISGLTLSEPLKIQYKPVTPAREHVRHRLRGAPQRLLRGRVAAPTTSRWRSASRSSRTRLLGPRRQRPPNDGTRAQHDRARLVLAARARLLQEVRPRRGRSCKEVLTRIAWKNHKNGAQNPKAQFQKEVPMETIMNSPHVAGSARHLGLLGRVATARRPRSSSAPRTRTSTRKNPIYIKALSFVAGPAEGRFARTTTSRPSPRSSPRHGRLRAGRHHEPARTRSAWPRCTTASRRPSWC